MNLHRLLALSPLVLAAALPAAPRSSASYSLPADTTDSAGKRSTSASYSHDGSLGGLAGVASVAAPVVVAKSGYLGQLYDVTGLQLSAAPATIDETGTRQLSARLLLDDATTLPVAATDVVWHVQDGPLASIDSSGLATAATVILDTTATAQGFYRGATGTLELTVLDTLTDNFGLYANDGISDAWQAMHFGVNSPDAAPAKDPDADGQNNFFEYLAGLDPTNPLSLLTVTVAIPPGQPTRRAIIFNPLVAGRNYTVTTTTNFLEWSYLTTPEVTELGSERTVIDVNASGARQFYRVEITRP